MSDETSAGFAKQAVAAGAAGRRYEPGVIEPKWLRRWEQDRLYYPDLVAAKRKFYNLMEFPYPSAEGLHVGHVFTYCGSDTFGRFRRMQGYDVFEPMGFDAFGIHSENYAIRQGINPNVLTARTTRHYREDQMKRLGAMFDWSREVNTSSPDYYRWTQWIFLQMYKAGLAVRKRAPVNWCPSCLTVLANEQVVDGSCERCSSEVVQREMVQWFFRITEYADRLLAGLADLDWPETSRKLQSNWIGRSEGAEIRFGLAGAGAAGAPGGACPEGGDRGFTVFTTRPDTLFGVTYMVLAPEHPLVDEVTTPEQLAAVAAYRDGVRRIKEIERLSTDREKTGVATGGYAVNPGTGQPVPVWIADYVLMHYGTGAVMGVPGHDQRDYEFATKFGLPIVEVISSEAGIAEAAYTGEGTMVNSGRFDGMPSEQGKRAVTDWLAARGQGKLSVTYRLRDWCISRQRYWGPPIPIIYCRECGEMPVPEEQLPVLLPDVEEFRPSGTGKGPLALVEEFVRTTCPKCGGPAERETDVSDTFLDSAWYFLRYPSVGRDDVPFDAAITAKWLPVDQYMGGIEHVCMHHLYARFVNMVLYDLGHVGFSEPFRRLRLHGLLIKDGAKMSKSRGNVVNPDQYIAQYGADVFRSYLLFIGPYEDENDFSDQGIQGVARFFNRVWYFVNEASPSHGQGVDMVPLHRAIRKVTEDLEALSYHTAIAAIMELTNWAYSVADQFTAQQRDEVARTMALLLAPFGPMAAEELWERMGQPYSIHNSPWPQYDAGLLARQQVTIVVQVNGRVRERFAADRGLGEADAIAAAQALPRIAELLAAKRVKQGFYVQDRLVNLIVE
jgi:leucyl-tRNA synthetase